MRIAFIYANSWERHYPQVTEDFHRTVWCKSDSTTLTMPRAAMRSGIEPVFYCLSSSITRPLDFRHDFGFPLRAVPSRFHPGDFAREMSLRLLREVAREDYDLLCFYQYYRNGRYPDMFDLFALFCALTGRPFITHFQAGEFYLNGKTSRIKAGLLKPRYWIKRWAMGQAERITSCNTVELEKLSNPAHPQYYGLSFDPSRCVHVPNIVDPELFHPMPRAEACASIGRDPAHTYILYVGFLREAKGIQDLVAALPGLLAEYPGVRLLIVGNGAYEGALRLQAARAGLGAVVDFVGAVAHDRLCPYYGASAVHVLPSHHEGLPSVLLEALACGTPSIGTRVGGIPEVLGNGVGMLVPPHDPPALQSALRRVLGGEFRTDGEQRRRLLSHHSYENTGRIFRSMCEEVLRAPHTRRRGRLTGEPVAEGRRA
jgi:glycosyltransferase involved in cell wall biosynthesis